MALLLLQLFLRFVRQVEWSLLTAAGEQAEEPDYQDKRGDPVCVHLLKYNR